MERYPAYKKSGIEWLENIPKHWQLNRAKALFTKTSRPVLPEDKIITVFRNGQVTLRENRRTSGFTQGIIEHGYQGLRKGDLVLHAMDAFAGAIRVSDSDGRATPEYLAYVPIDKDKIYTPFYGLLLRQMALSGFVLAIGKSVRERSPRFKHTKFLTLELPVPPVEEQRAIAHYLDTKTAQIDRKIDLLTQKATQYSNLKQSLINETVTRGLDKSVPMEDSGVEWIGIVPKHWKIRHFKKISTMKGRIGWQGLKHSEFIDKGPFLITGMNFKKGEIKWDEVYHITYERYEQAPEIQLRENDVLMTKDGTIGKLLFVESIPAPHKASLNSHLLVFRPVRESYDPKYLYYQLDSSAFRMYTDITKVGTTFFGISQAAVGRYIGMLPPIDEQKMIASYLDTKSAQIDRIIQNTNIQIEKLQELRKTLINDVVTGKIKVA